MAAEVEDDDPDDDVDRIKWFLTENGSDVEVEIDEDTYVSIDEYGRSVLRMPREDAKVGKYRCEGSTPVHHDDVIIGRDGNYEVSPRNISVYFECFLPFLRHF